MIDPQPDFAPQPGQPEDLGSGIRRILAPNPSAMTFRGTNTYLVGHRGVAVIDPGPDDPAHLRAILAALLPGQRITHILATHAHRDHSPLAPELARETGAPVLAFGDSLAGRSPAMQALAAREEIGGGEGVDHAFRPDKILPHGGLVAGDGWRIEALHTPGHFGNHMCFAHGKALFSGDLVMGWASSLISPPDGDLSDFMASLRLLAERDWNMFLPGHGDLVRAPAARLAELLAHRQRREAEILAALAHGPATAADLAARIYTDTPPALHPAAARNILAHLINLDNRGLTTAQGPIHSSAVFMLA